jgi:hypothetical protein
MDDEISQERYEIPEPEPITVAGIRYEAMPWGKARGLDQNGGYIAAVDVVSNQELWLQKIYGVAYDLEMETDVQDVFISSLTLHDGNLLDIENEQGDHYLLNLVTRAVNKWE